METTPAEKVYGTRDRPNGSIGEDEKLSFRTADALIEFKPEDELYNLGSDDPNSKTFLKEKVGNIDRLGHIGKYACHCFAFSHRVHLFTVYIRGTMARLIRWDRSGAIISTEFDITTEKHLVVFLYR
ncbi:hypothetical protein BDV98DRAFT_513150, partial [Pterulicium gracile]